MKTTLLVSLLVVCAFASGCAAKLISANEKTVIVQARRSDMAGALDIAETECFKRGLHARAVSKPSEEQFGFECVR